MQQIGEFLGRPIVIDESMPPSAPTEIRFGDLGEYTKRRGFNRPAYVEGDELIQPLTEAEYEALVWAGVIQ